MTKSVRESLSSLLSSDVEEVNIDEGSNALDKVKEEQALMVEEKFASITDNSINQARSVVDYCLDFYYKEKFISDNDYIKARANLEKLTIAGLYKQIQLNTAMIEDISKKILTISAQPTQTARLYEVFAKLQEVNLQFSRQLTMQVVALDEQMKRLKVDHSFFQKSEEDNPEETVRDISENKNKKTYRGQKELMKQLKNKKDNND